jgi:hypothetical protein
MSNVQTVQSVPAIPGLWQVLPPQLAKLAASKVLRYDPRKMEPTGLVIEGFTFNAADLIAYQDICGFARSSRIPFPYPHVAAFGGQVELMGAWSFPLPLLGSVHGSQRMWQPKPLNIDEGPFTVTIDVGRFRPDAKGRGVDYDVRTLLTTGLDIRWASQATYKANVKLARRPERAEEKAVEEIRFNQMQLLDVSKTIGKKYGEISGDGNPIHQEHAPAVDWILGKLFGIPKLPVTHGMWMGAATMALLEDTSSDGPMETLIKFVDFLPYPNQLLVQYNREQAPVMHFKAAPKNPKKPTLVGMTTHLFNKMPPSWVTDKIT